MESFQEIKDGAANAKCLGVPRPHGEGIPVIDACDTVGGGRLY